MKFYLCGITQAGKKQHLEELIEPIKHCFDGLQWCFHYPTDEGADYLEKNKGEGRIVYSHFSGRHGFSQTQYLWQGTMKEGDWFVQIDDQERMSPELCQSLKNSIPAFEKSGIGMLANYGKGLLFKFTEELEFKGSPHWYATNIPGKSINYELSKDLFWNVRNRERNEWQFIDHYLKYYVNYPAGSNHCLLGLEKNGNPQELFPKRENTRLLFRKYIYSLNIPDSKILVEYWKNNPLEQKMRDFINSEKILNDAYRFHILGRKDFIDNHDFKNMITV